MEIKEKYLREIIPKLQRAGFTVWPEHDGLLPVEWNAELLCHVKADGSLLYQKEILSNRQMSEALDRVTSIVLPTLAYMRQMEQAPLLRVAGLSGDYRLLAEFDGVVLAGHEREGPYGVEFVTWERVQNNTALWQGHYHDNDYAAARQDFAVRSGLIDENRLLSDEQMALVYRCVRDALQNDGTLTAEQETILREVSEKISESVPEEQIARMAAPKQGMEQSW